jgi:hypothetical protein
MLRQKHRRLRRNQASFTTKGLRPLLSSGDTNSGLLQIVEESREVEICVGLVDAVKIKATRNKLKRLATAGEDDTAVCKAAAAQNTGILKAGSVAQNLNLVTNSIGGA